MNINKYVLRNELRPADAIVLRKKFMGMFSHYAIFLGYENGQPQFVANFFKGVKIIPNKEINEQLKTYKPQKIERFKGNTYQRQSAIERAWSKIGEKAYGLASNNCEHFKNWVHYGKAISKQVDNIGTGSLILGTVMTIGGGLSSNAKARNWGIASLILGGVLKSLAEKK